MTQDGSRVTLTAYPGTPAAFVRVIDLRRDAGVLHPPCGEGEVMLATDPELAIIVYADRPSRWWVTVPLAGKLWRWG